MWGNGAIVQTEASTIIFFGHLWVISVTFTTNFIGLSIPNTSLMKFVSFLRNDMINRHRLDWHITLIGYLPSPPTQHFAARWSGVCSTNWPLDGSNVAVVRMRRASEPCDSSVSAKQQVVCHMPGQLRSLAGRIRTVTRWFAQKHDMHDFLMRDSEYEIFW